MRFWNAIGVLLFWYFHSCIVWRFFYVLVSRVYMHNFFTIESLPFPFNRKSFFVEKVFTLPRSTTITPLLVQNAAIMQTYLYTALYYMYLICERKHWKNFLMRMIPATPSEHSICKRSYCRLPTTRNEIFTRMTFHYIGTQVCVYNAYEYIMDFSRDDGWMFLFTFFLLENCELDFVFTMKNILGVYRKFNFCSFICVWFVYDLGKLRTIFARTYWTWTKINIWRRVNIHHINVR